MAYEEAILLDVRKEWIVEEKKPGVRALCEFGKLVSRHGPLPSPGDLPLSLRAHCIDGVLGANVYHVFDLPVFEGRDVRNRPLHERRALLRQLALPTWFCHIPTGKNITEFLEAVERDGGEGVIIKSLTQSYGSAEWIKPREGTQCARRAVLRGKTGYPRHCVSRIALPRGLARPSDGGNGAWPASLGRLPTYPVRPVLSGKAGHGVRGEGLTP